MTITAPESLVEPERRVGPAWIGSLTAATLGMWIVYFGPTVLLLPIQAAHAAPEDKENSLGLITGVGALVLMVAHILFGLASDRTTSRFGRRKPWIVGGVAVSTVSMLLLSQQDTVTGLLVGWCLVQLGSAAIFCGLLAAMPDHVPSSQRGLISGLVGLAQAGGSLVGSMVIAITADPLTGYGLCAVLQILAVLPFLLLNRDPVLPPGRRPVLRSLWISPRKNRDFMWAIASQFLITISFVLASLYTLFYLTDVIRHEDPVAGTATASIITTIGTLCAAAVFGHISDRLGRRKMFAVAAGVVMALSSAILVVDPTWELYVLSSVLLGLGLGMANSVDLAIASEVLPSPDDRAKDLGVNNISKSLPQFVAPVMAAPLLTAADGFGYSMIFLMAAVCALLGGLLTLKIRTVS
ncbi:MFS transporter [Crossiella cryophila]|uniref:MFS family permease n=1 Tax=Crossiella cryophila TaxID=43355 RepID=A0A7W7FTP2_9PSEU|nr:MFS transporter [Crossiella cryophila]MBB4675009.1 MFS family permease [Crossiella cryophila]